MGEWTLERRGPSENPLGLTPNQREVMEALRWWGAPEFGNWVRPMDVGGRNSSHHSHTLAALARKGLVEERVRSSGWRGSKLYRITVAGWEAAEKLVGPLLERRVV